MSDAPTSRQRKGASRSTGGWTRRGRWVEGAVSVLGYRLFCRSIGSGRRGTVLTLHGGPGATHDYLLPLADLAERGYRVVFYDQLGCGRSQLPRDWGLFTVERYAEEVEALRRTLRLGRVHLIGSSWGGLLALAVALRYPRSLRSLVTVGGLASVPLARTEMLRLIRRLPRPIRSTLAREAAAGRYFSPAFRRALEVFYQRHTCRLLPWPREVVHSFAMAEQRPVYSTMNGPNEFTIIGTIRYYDCSRELARIRLPTLVAGGRFDEITPRVARQIHAGIRGSTLALFPQSSHLPFWEERERFMRVVGEFLDRAGSRRSVAAPSA